MSFPLWLGTRPKHPRRFLSQSASGVDRTLEGIQRLENPFDQPSPLAQDVRVQEHSRFERLLAPIGDDGLARQCDRDSIERLTGLGIADKRPDLAGAERAATAPDRKSTRLNSSH